MAASRNTSGIFYAHLFNNPSSPIFTSSPISRSRWRPYIPYSRTVPRRHFLRIFLVFLKSEFFLTSVLTCFLLSYAIFLFFTYCLYSICGCSCVHMCVSVASFLSFYICCLALLDERYDSARRTQNKSYHNLLSATPIILIVSLVSIELSL